MFGTVEFTNAPGFFGFNSFNSGFLNRVGVSHLKVPVIPARGVRGLFLNLYPEKSKNAQKNQKTLLIPQLRRVFPRKYSAPKS